MVIRHPAHSFFLTQGSTRIKVLEPHYFLSPIPDPSSSAIAQVLLSDSRNATTKMREAVILMEQPAYRERKPRIMAVSPPLNDFAHSRIHRYHLLRSQQVPLRRVAYLSLLRIAYLLSHCVNFDFIYRFILSCRGFDNRAGIGAICHV